MKKTLVGKKYVSNLNIKRLVDQLSAIYNNSFNLIKIQQCFSGFPPGDCPPVYRVFFLIPYSLPPK